VIDWLRRPAPALPPPKTTRRSIEIGGRPLPLAIRTLRTARRMTLRLAPDGSEARITMPPWGRVGEAESFARERSDWLARQLAARPKAEPVGSGSTLGYRGETLAVRWDPRVPRRPLLGEGEIVIGGPEAGLERRLARWLEGEALRLFAGDAADYAARVGIAVPEVRLSRAARRWGSCATNGTVRLNWRLVMAPDPIRRSVVAHEIAHLVHFDHSPRFHALLADLFEGDVAEANRWLKRHGRTLYTPFG
jgi:predicted metal-dependent hydrolase